MTGTDQPPCCAEARLTAERDAFARCLTPERHQRSHTCHRTCGCPQPDPALRPDDPAGPVMIGGLVMARYTPTMSPNYGALCQMHTWHIYPSTGPMRIGANHP